VSVSAFSGFRKTPFSRLPIIQSLKGASAAGFWCCTADKISSHAPNTMAELPTPPSLLDEVNPRLVVAVTRSQKRKREVERALVTVSSLFGAPSSAGLCQRAAAFEPKQGSYAPKIWTSEAARPVRDTRRMFLPLDTTPLQPKARKILFRLVPKNAFFPMFPFL